MALKDELISIEKELWTGDDESYLRNLDADCLVAFTEMAGVHSREQVAKSVAGAERWRDLQMDVKGVLALSDDIAFLTYHASAVRGPNEHYQALVSSGYVRRNGSWKLAFHQQTPL